MLFNIGDAEMTVGELTLRGCYLGSNVSYNVKKMVENEYLVHKRSVHDRRSIHVRLTEKGIKLRDSLIAMHRAPCRDAVADRCERRRSSGRRRHASSARALLEPRRRLSAATAAAGTGYFASGSASFRLMHDLRPGGNGHETELVSLSHHRIADTFIYADRSGQKAVSIAQSPIRRRLERPRNR